jgi:hypothetical protein
MSKFIGHHVQLCDGRVTGPITKRETQGPYILTDGRITWTAEGKTLTGDRPDSSDIFQIVKHIPFNVNTDGVVLTDNPSFGRIYLAGPMAGYPERNYPAFMRAAKALRDLGYEVYNPAEYEANERFKGQEDRSEFPLREAFTEYTNYILNRADIIALLPGHENSVGASAELALARVVKLKEIYL